MDTIRKGIVEGASGIGSMPPFFGKCLDLGRGFFTFDRGLGQSGETQDTGCSRLIGTGPGRGAGDVGSMPTWTLTVSRNDREIPLPDQRLLPLCPPALSPVALNTRFRVCGGFSGENSETNAPRTQSWVGAIRHGKDDSDAVRLSVSTRLFNECSLRRASTRTINAGRPGPLRPWPCWAMGSVGNAAGEHISFLGMQGCGYAYAG